MGKVGRLLWTLKIKMSSGGGASKYTLSSGKGEQFYVAMSGCGEQVRRAAGNDTGTQSGLVLSRLWASARKLRSILQGSGGHEMF